MLFKKKKNEEQDAGDVSKEIEYSPEELQLIGNLIEDFAKPPGHIEIASDEGEEPVFGGDQPVEEPAEDDETQATTKTPEPAFKPKTTAEPAGLDEFDDLADLDLDSLEKPPAQPQPASDDLGLDDFAAATPEPETEPTKDIDLGDLEDTTSPAAEDFDLDNLGAPAEPATDDFDLDNLGAPAKPATDDFDLDNLGAPAEPATDDFDLDNLGAPAEPATDDFDLDNLGAPAEPATDDFDLDNLGAPAEPATDDFDLDNLGAPAEPAGKPAADDFDFDNLDTTTQAGGDFGLDDLETGLSDKTGDLGMDDFSSAAAPGGDDFSFDDMAPPSLDDVSPEVIQKSAQKSFGDFDLADELNELADEQKEKEISDEQLSSLRYTLKSYSPLVRQNVIDTILGNKLGKADTGELVKKLVAGIGETEVKKFLEDKLGKKLADTGIKKETDRKVIVTRPQYTEKGIAGRKRMVSLAKFAIIAVPVFLLLGGSIYYFGIKKYLYHRDINKGKEIILSQSFLSSDTPKAEKYFEKAIERYPGKSEAYLQFADAYRRQGLYENAFEKLFGKISINPGQKAIRFENREINRGEDFWNVLQKVPIIRYKGKDRKILYINDIPWKLQKKGAYILTHLDQKKDEAIVLYALGSFHSSPARKFSQSAYRNNRLGIDYYNRILNFKSSTPMFQREKFLSAAILGIGDIYYHNDDYNKAHDYFEKIIRKDPYDVEGQTGMMKSLIKMYESPSYQTSNDPRLIIQQHSLIKHTYKIEKKLPLYMLARLARFYIDLPDKDDLRIEYNTSPIDKVNNRTLKSRAEELLNIMYAKTDEDIYGNKISGKTFAEGYYQRGRYFRYVVKEYRMAMTQFEYAFKYDPNHFMALNDRAEILMELNDYEGAKKHLLLAEEKISDSFQDNLGDRPEDETLLEADRGVITFNLAKTLYLSRVKNLDSSHDWFRMQETEKFEESGEYGKEALITMLDQVDMYLDKAENQGLKSDYTRSELAYYRGWINYVKSDYPGALLNWQSISPTWNDKMPNLELAKSYALYYMGTRNKKDQRRYMETSLSHLYYLQGKYAPLAEKIARPNESNRTHETIFSKMSIIENNMGAVFEMMGEEENALKHYQKSVEYSKKINKENEIAQLNIRLSFKRMELDVHEKYPLIMDFISPYLKDNVL